MSNLRKKEKNSRKEKKKREKCGKISRTLGKTGRLPHRGEILRYSRTSENRNRYREERNNGKAWKIPAQWPRGGKARAVHGRKSA